MPGFIAAAFDLAELARCLDLQAEALQVGRGVQGLELDADFLGAVAMSDDRVGRLFMAGCDLFKFECKLLDHGGIIGPKLQALGGSQVAGPAELLQDFPGGVLVLLEVRDADRAVGLGLAVSPTPFGQGFDLVADREQRFRDLDLITTYRQTRDRLSGPGRFVACVVARVLGLAPAVGKVFRKDNHVTKFVELLEQLHAFREEFQGPLNPPQPVRFAELLAELGFEPFALGLGLAHDLVLARPVLGGDGDFLDPRLGFADRGDGLGDPLVLPFTGVGEQLEAIGLEARPESLSGRRCPSWRRRATRRACRLR